MANTLTIVCSNKPRNGKTLLARMIADRLSLTGADSFRIFDTDFPEGGLAGYFPESSEIVDLAKTQGQVRIFDTILAETGVDYIIDLQSDLLDAFFRIFSDIGFEHAAREAGLNLSIYFILDRAMTTMQSARRIGEMLHESDFVLVRNEAVGNVLTLPEAARIRAQIKNARDLSMPALSIEAANFIEKPEFTFAGFVARNGEGAPLEMRIELWNFLEAVYNQRGRAAEGAVLL